MELKLSELRAKNRERADLWTPEGVPLSFRGLELAGEVGEACNHMKKIERARLGLKGGDNSEERKQKLATELADALICVDLIAMDAGIDLGAAVISKFNATSFEHGFDVLL